MTDRPNLNLDANQSGVTSTRTSLRDGPIQVSPRIAGAIIVAATILISLGIASDYNDPESACQRRANEVADQVEQIAIQAGQNGGSVMEQINARDEFVAASCP